MDALSQYAGVLSGKLSMVAVHAHIFASALHVIVDNETLYVDAEYHQSSGGDFALLMAMLSAAVLEVAQHPHVAVTACAPHVLEQGPSSEVITITAVISACRKSIVSLSLW